MKSVPSTTAEPAPPYAPPDGPLTVLHQDEALIFVDKPPGLLSVPGKTAALSDCLETRLRRACPGTRLIHRLDMDTSGVMVFARNWPAQKHVNAQFEARSVEKRYVALVAGIISKDQGRIALPLIADWPRRPLQKVCFETGKPAVTRWQVLARGSNQTRVALYPETGRSHQLRVHMKEISHPILGDRFYATGEALTAAPRLWLHAETLTLTHPVGHERMCVTAETPF